MSNSELSSILTKLSEHEIRIKHLEDLHKGMLQMQATLLKMNDRMIRVEDKVSNMEKEVKQMQQENAVTMQKLINAVTNGYQAQIKTDQQIRIEKLSMVEKWVMRIIITANTVLLGYFGLGGHL